MKPIVKTILTISALLPLAGCLDFGWSKKADKQEQGQAPMQAAAENKDYKCPHKGCTHNHSKDAKKHAGKHKDDVEVQDFEDEEDYDNQEMNAYQDSNYADNQDMDDEEYADDVETQGMDDEDDDDNA